jgi:hypothetical protein
MNADPQLSLPSSTALRSTTSQEGQGIASGSPGAASPHPLIRQWGAIQGMKDDPDGEILQASIVQALGDQTYTAYIDIVPVQSKDVAPADDRDTKKMLVTFIDEHFRTDANVSVLGESLKYGAVRSTHLTGWPPQDKIYTCEVRLNVEQVSQSRLLGGLFTALGSVDDRSPLDFEHRRDWPMITPAVQEPRYKFAIMLMPSSRSPRLELTAYSAEPPAIAKRDICTLLGLPDLAQRSVAIYSRLTSVGPLTEITCWDPPLLSTIINGIQHVGTGFS